MFFSYKGSQIGPRIPININRILKNDIFRDIISHDMIRAYKDKRDIEIMIENLQMENYDKNNLFAAVDIFSTYIERKQDNVEFVEIVTQKWNRLSSSDQNATISMIYNLKSRELSDLVARLYAQSLVGLSRDNMEMKLGLVDATS